MFGYVRPVMDRLSDEDKRKFQAAYCGLCHTLGKRYGSVSRFLLNYDFTFLAILLSKGKLDGITDFHCAAEGFRKRGRMDMTPALELAADESIILSRWKLCDEIDDSSGGKKAAAAAAAAALKSKYKKAKLRCPDFDVSVREHLSNLAELEKAECDSMDRVANEFAMILSKAGKGSSENENRVFAQLLYHLGRWVYLIDAADDLKDDLKSGSYNPLRYRFETENGELKAEDKQYFISTIDHSVNIITSAYQLLDFGEWSGVIENILYLGLPAVGSAVMSGQWQKKNRNYDEEII